MKRTIFLLLAALLLFAALPVLAETAADTDVSLGLDVTAAAQAPDELLQQWIQIGQQLRLNGYYPFVELEKGNTGYEVIALQTRLTELGYYTKEIVDYYGNGTYNGMREFEKANGLKVNGIASPEDQRILFSADAVAFSGKRTTTSQSSGGGNTSGEDAMSGATEEAP